MKSKLLPVLLILLVVLNGVLIFMLIHKPHQNKRPKEERNFLIEQLQFTNTQKDRFITIDDAHRDHMMSFEHQIRKNKDVLFNSFSDKTINIDSLSAIIGALQGKKEMEVFGFFKAVRKICTSKQQEKFDKIIKKAIRGGRKGPPREGDLPPSPPR
jgi:archaellum biogenesis ATPase FlaH